MTKAHADELWLRKLEIHLSVLKQQGLLALRHDRLTAPGIDWAHAIDQCLETASVLFFNTLALLVTRRF